MTATDAGASALRHALSRIDRFAEHIVGEPLWPHQVEMALSPARIRVMCAGRQVGKSRELAIEALYTAITKPGSLTMLVSAGETASQRLLEECANLATNSPLLAGSVLDDTKHRLTTTTGSRIESVPASQKQIRGPSADLLIIDEAGFVDNTIWRAAEPIVIARPGSRIILSSSPWGGVDHFFRKLWHQGMTAPSERYASFHWPSSLNPNVSEDDLAAIQAREPAHYFNREYLAEWTDEAGTYFTTEELDNAVADYRLLDPMTAARRFCVGGLDWGMAHDANAAVYLAASGDVELNRDKFGESPVFWIPAIDQQFRMDYSAFIDRVRTQARNLGVYRYVSESNGVGQMPSQVLRDMLSRDFTDDVIGHRVSVRPVATTAQRKAGGFGRIKMLLQQGRLVLPRHPELLKQLHALTYEQLDSGLMRISVPENIGHDDLAMALMQAVSIINPNASAVRSDIGGQGEILTTGRGTRIPAQPSASDYTTIFLGGNGTKV
ncbi:terminase large subunit domain-containing protein [Gordonia polyisoprenivorans]|uniref:terminase large subunit domain-containing protein n=1 Tax=Gordonia polyisoprenivorans TaxID=84595 RepID=UPI0003716B68|nr:terminase family protein [Gordonia polyisoprenivorans]